MVIINFFAFYYVWKSLLYKVKKVILHEWPDLLFFVIFACTGPLNHWNQRKNINFLLIF